MTYRSSGRVFFSIVGILSFVIYILACRASWSPDSSKILFHYSYVEQDQASIALHDRETGLTTPWFLQADNDLRYSVQWESGGERALLQLEDRLLVLPVGSSRPALTIKLDAEENPLGWPWPSPEVDGNLYLGGDSLLRLNLNTGEGTTGSTGTEDKVSLFGRGDRIFYSHEIEKVQDDDGQLPGVMEIGEVNPDDLSMKPLVTIRDAELAERGVGSVFDIVFQEPYFSLVGRSLEGRDVIVLYTEEGIDRVVTPELPDESYRLGIHQLSPNGEIIYAPMFTPAVAPETKVEDKVEDEDAEWMQVSLVEIPTEGGSARIIPVVRARANWDDDDNITAFWISLSPDGAMIALPATLELEDELAPEDRVLYLIDVKDPDRTVTKIPMPPPQNPVEDKEAE